MWEEQAARKGVFVPLNVLKYTTESFAALFPLHFSICANPNAARIKRNSSVICKLLTTTNSLTVLELKLSCAISNKLCTNETCFRLEIFTHSMICYCSFPFIRIIEPLEWLFQKHILKTNIIFGRIVRNRATEKAKADMVVGTSPTQPVGGSAMTQPQQIHPTPVITPVSTAAGYTIHTLLGINQPVALTDVAQKRKREEGEYNFNSLLLKFWKEF